MVDSKNIQIRIKDSLDNKFTLHLQDKTNDYSYKYIAPIDLVGIKSTEIDKFSELLLSQFDIEESDISTIFTLFPRNLTISRSGIFIYAYSTLKIPKINIDPSIEFLTLIKIYKILYESYPVKFNSTPIVYITNIIKKNLTKIDDILINNLHTPNNNSDIYNTIFTYRTFSIYNYILFKNYKLFGNHNNYNDFTFNIHTDKLEGYIITKKKCAFLTKLHFTDNVFYINNIYNILTYNNNILSYYIDGDQRDVNYNDTISNIYAKKYFNENDFFIDNDINNLQLIDEMLIVRELKYMLKIYTGNVDFRDVGYNINESQHTLLHQIYNDSHAITEDIAKICKYRALVRIHLNILQFIYTKSYLLVNDLLTQQSIMGSYIIGLQYALDGISLNDTSNLNQSQINIIEHVKLLYKVRRVKMRDILISTNSWTDRDEDYYENIDNINDIIERFKEDNELYQLGLIESDETFLILAQDQYNKYTTALSIIQSGDYNSKKYINFVSNFNYSLIKTILFKYMNVDKVSLSIINNLSDIQSYGSSMIKELNNTLNFIKAFKKYDNYRFLLFLIFSTKDMKVLVDYNKTDIMQTVFSEIFDTDKSLYINKK